MFCQGQMKSDTSRLNTPPFFRKFFYARICSSQRTSWRAHCVRNCSKNSSLWIAHELRNFTTWKFAARPNPEFCLIWAELRSNKSVGLSYSNKSKFSPTRPHIFTCFSLFLSEQLRFCRSFGLISLGIFVFVVQIIPGRGLLNFIFFTSDLMRN